MEGSAARRMNGLASAAPALVFALLFSATAARGWAATAPAPAAPAPGIAIQSHTESDACASGGAGGGDGVLDPGETVAIAVTAVNNYSAAATGVTGTLTCSAPGVTVTVPGASFGDMAAGATASSAAPFSIALSRSLACGTSLDFTLTFDSSQGVSSAGFSLVVGRVTPPTTVTVLSESFESWPPPGWVLLPDPSTGGAWDSLAHAGGCIAGSSFPYANNTGGAGLCADANSDCLGDGMDTTMVTPSFSLATPGLVSAQLQFKSDFYCAASLDEGWVDVTTDEGAVWTNLLYFDHQSVRGPDTETLDLTPYLGQPDVRLSFEYAAPGWDWYWQVDDVTVTAVQQGSCAMTPCAAVPCTLDCSASAPADAAVGAPVAFTATATPSGGCTGTPAFAWDFGDGQTSAEQNPTHAYAAPGTYGWTLTVGDGGVTCSKGGSIAVSEGCSYTLSSVFREFGHGGGSAMVAVTVSGPASCGAPPLSSSETWVEASWKKQTPRRDVMLIKTDPNASATPRNAQVFVGNAVFSVAQEGAPCKVTAVSPAKQIVDASGGDEQIAVTATEGACPWTAAPNGAASSWITVLVGSGTGPGAAVYAVAPNATGKKRTGTLSVATALGKKTVTVKQLP